MAMFPRKRLRLPFGSEEIEEAFSQLIHQPWGRDVGEWIPNIDVYETDDAYLVEADLPGVALRDVEITVQDHWLTICGSRKSDSVVESRQGVRLERRQGRFCRKFFLEHGVDLPHVETSQEEGVLRVRLPKAKGDATTV